jgi:hypothetical protein
MRSREKHVGIPANGCVRFADAVTAPENTRAIPVRDEGAAEDRWIPEFRGIDWASCSESAPDRKPQPPVRR